MVSQPNPEVARTPTLARWGTSLAQLAARYNSLMIGISDWIFAIVGLYLVGAMIAQFNKNNMTLGIAIIAILCALSSSTFAFARAIEQSCSHRDKVLFAGERLLHGAVLALMGAMLKWIQFDADQYPLADKYGVIVILIRWLAGMSSITMFMFSFFYARIGLKTLSSILFGLAGRHPELVH